MNVLLTGAFGNIGVLCIEKILAEGHQVRCSDIDGPAQRRLAKKFAKTCDIQLGDICDATLLSRLVDGIDAIIHLAALLPPTTENRPEMAYAVNVEATKRLIDIAARQTTPPLFIFSSSLTVFGPSQRDKPVRSSADPISASDNYTQHKILAEEYLQQSSLPWVIMRVGVAIDSRMVKTERSVLRQMLSIHPDTPLEYVHPRDVATAMARALTVPQAQGKVLLLGGGGDCQATHYQFINAAFSAMGLAQASSLFGSENYYTHWMDTDESQRLLQFQQTTFADYQNELREKFAGMRFLTSPARPILKALLPRALKRI